LFKKLYFKILHDKIQNYSPIHLVFYVTVVVSAALWSSLIYLPGTDDLSSYLVDMQIIMGIATVAAIATLFLSLPSSLTFIAITGSVFISRILQLNDSKMHFLGIEIILITIAMMALAVYLYKVQISFLLIANKNKELLRTQNLQQMEITRLNDNLEKRLKDERIISVGIQDALDFQSRVLENSLSGMFVIDTSGNFIQLNEIGASILGYSKEELFGKPAVLYFENSASGGLKLQLLNVLKKGKIIKGYETFINQKNGNTAQIILNASPLQKGNKISGAVVIIDDSTEKNRQNIMRKIRIDTLEMATSEKNLENIVAFVLKGFNNLNSRFSSVFFLYDQNTEKFSYSLSTGIPKNLIKQLQNTRDEIADLPHYKAKTIKKPYKLNNLSKLNFPGYYKKYLVKNKINSSLSIPIRDSHDQIAGIFEIYSFELNFPDGIDMQYVREFAQLIGLVTERKKIENELKVKNKSLSSLYELSSTVLKEIDQDILFDKIFHVLNSIQEIETIDRIKIFLPKAGRLELYYNSQKSDEHEDYCRNIGIGECLCGKTFVTGEVIFSGNSEVDPDHSIIDKRLPAHSHITIPLIGKEKICGVLCLYTAKTNINLSENKKFFFLSVGRQVGLALENTSLYEELKKMSLNDPLTGLANRHRMNIVVQKLIPKMKRKKIPVALAFLDIDHFKEFNDTYGHALGDQLLMTIAKIIQETIREEDLAVRYGGEEFLLIFSETDIPTAKNIVERIRNLMVEKTNITMSAGISSFLSEMSFDEALELADQALYKAKNTGRDKIVTTELTIQN
jgi:diguanylate cyclase (GGDEF)-like protein/PAS domain S-box-containing protein